MLNNLHCEQSRGMQILLDWINVENKSRKGKAVPNKVHLSKTVMLESADLKKQQCNARQQEIIDRAECHHELQMCGMGNGTHTPSTATIFEDTFGPSNQNTWFDEFNAQLPVPVPDALQPTRTTAPDILPVSSNIANLNSGSADNAIINGNDNTNATTDQCTTNTPANNVGNHRTDQTTTPAPPPTNATPSATPGGTSQGDQGNTSNQCNRDLPANPNDEDHEMDIATHKGDMNDRTSNIGRMINWLLLLILLTNVISLLLQ